MLHTAYVRFREDLPDGHNLCAIADGFSRLGVKVKPFYGFGDVASLPDLGPEACVCGYICDVNAAMDTLGIPRPEVEDYPRELIRFLGRTIISGTLGDVRRATGRVFVKPRQQKLFTGFVWGGAHADRIRVATFPDSTPIYMTRVVDLVSEYRAFIMGREILGVKHYSGDWGVAPDRRVVEDAVASCPASPVAFSLDWGVTSDCRTILIERNDATALGHYGLNSELYAKMVEARWLELVQTSTKV